MKKLLSILIVLTLLLSVTKVQADAKRPQVSTGHLLCIDPGHGGTDTGATATGVNGTITEAQENLVIAQDLEASLSAAQIPWVATRTDNSQTLSNADRYNFCNSQGATLELSIHLNGSTDSSVDYTEVLYGKQTKDKAWAQTVDSALSLGIANNGITNFADGVLLKVNMPAALAESVFITNTNEYNLLTNGTGNRQQQIADQLSQAVQTWFASH